MTGHVGTPIPGDRGYLDWLRERKHTITEREWRDQRLLHFNLFRILAPRDPRGEAGFLGDLSAMLDARPAEGEESPSVCRYEAHRAAGDWRAADGRLRCRVCHPPISGAER